MDRPVEWVGDHTCNIRRHLFCSEAVRGRGVFDVQAEAEKDALVQGIQGRLGVRIEMG